MGGLKTHELVPEEILRPKPQEAGLVAINCHVSLHAPVSLVTVLTFSF